MLSICLNGKVEVEIDLMMVGSIQRAALHSSCAPQRWAFSSPSRTQKGPSESLHLFLCGELSLSLSRSYAPRHS